MSNETEQDYVLGTHDEELRRLGIQHDVWRSVVLDCWKQAGITAGHRVLDVGAGPGYTTLDLAELVGTRGEVAAIERSARFVQAAKAVCEARGLKNVRFYELDLMTDPLPVTGYDAAWIRWVACFVSSPAKLLSNLAESIRPGGVLTIHEYAEYATWRFSPRIALVEQFAERVMESWRAAGGEPNIALALPPLLVDSGFRIRSATPKIFCIRPSDPMWQWPASFLDINLNRLLELKRVDQQWVAAVRRAFAAVDSNPNALMITPLVLEIIAERCSP
jgi:SAM-dependent methyltransferase